MDGWVTIGTQLDSTQLEKDLKNQERELQKFQKEKEKLLQDKGKAETNLSGYEKEQKEYEKLVDKAEEYRHKLKELEAEKSQMFKNNPGLAISPDTPEYANVKQQIAEVKEELRKASDEVDKQMPKLEEVELKYNDQVSKIEQINLKLKENANNQGLISTKISETNSKIQQSKGMSDINEQIKNISSVTSSTIKKVAKWALAVFSVRSAYSLVMKASSTLSKYNKQYASDLEYISYAIAQSLAPVLEYIVKLAAKILTYINAIVNAWFGVNLFANASANSFEKASNSLSGVSDAMEDLKSTSEFDTANILGADKSTSSKSGSNTIAPSFDLSNIENIEVPKWITEFAEFCKPIIEFFQKIIDKFGPVAGGIIIVVGALAGFVILKSIIGWITGLGKATGGISADFTGFLNGLGKAALAIAVLGGIALVLNEVTDLITAFSESGLTLGEVAGLLGIVLGTLVIAFTAIAGATKLMDWTGIAGAAVILGGFELVIHEVTGLIKAFSESGLELNDVIGLMASIFVPIIALMGAIAILGPLMTAGMVPFLAVVAGISAILIVMALTLPTILDACGNFIKETAPSIQIILDSIGNMLEKIIKSIGEVLPPIIDSVGKLFMSIFNGISNLINTIGNTLVNILNTLKSLVTTVLSSILGFIRELGPAINVFVDNAIIAVTKLINFLISGIEYLVNTLVIGAINKIVSAVNIIPGVNIQSVNTMSIPRFVPRLATGAIINNPGKGIPVAGGRAIGGEAGMEGILPLTDAQAMEKLGESIGRYIKLNIDLTNKLDSRVISRILKEVTSEKSFALNGGI